MGLVSNLLIPNRVTGSYDYPYATPGSTFTHTNPDYRKLLLGDQQLTTGLAGLGFDQAGGLTGAGQAAILQAQEANARKAALEQFGGVPDFSASQAAAAGFAPGDIDALTRGLAAQNPNSVLAQLQNAYHTANDASVGDLGERGIVRSGALGQHLNQNLANFNTSLYGEGQKLLSGLGGLHDTYLTGIEGLNTQRQNLVGQAQDRLIAGINSGAYGPYDPVNSGPSTSAPTSHAAPAPFKPYGSPQQAQRQTGVPVTPPQPPAAPAYSPLRPQGGFGGFSANGFFRGNLAT